MSLRKKLGQAIRRLREKAGVSQETFAHQCGLARSYMGAVERGEKNVSIDNIEKIAKGLRVRTWELLAEAER